MTSDHLADIEQYCRDVESGKRLAAKWERLAVSRHLNDLEQSTGDGFPFRFDRDAAARVIRFTEAFPHVKGRWARATGTASKIRLEPWQKFVLGVLFGWVNKADGLRRFRIAYICVPRKNGKSVLAAAIGLYMMSEDEEPGAEIYCGATSEKQAWEVFRPA
ncbi:terminase, partial [Vibrio agarivorans]